MASFFRMYDNNNNDEEGCVPNLGFRERMIGFGVCIGLGYFLQVLSFSQLFSTLTGHPEKFAICYTLGNILAIGATGFLVGFKKQIQNMADKERRYTSLIFVSAMILTLLCAFVLHSGILITILLVIQICAYIWYTASYIPFARSMLKNCINGCFGRTIIPE